MRKWVHDRIAKFKTAWQDAGSGALYWMRRVVGLAAHAGPARRTDAGAGFGRRVASSCTIRQREAKSTSCADWRNYLTRQWRRHFFWLGFNAVIAPISVILAILPGPNLIGYWFAYRAVHHVIVVWGINRAQRNLIPTELHSVESLDRPVEHDGEGKARHAALEGAGEQLDQHVAWWRGSFLGIPRIRGARDQDNADEPANVVNRPEDRRDG